MTTRRTEMTVAGKQTLKNGVHPVTLRDRLQLSATLPMAPKRNPNAPQKSCNHGLFDEVGGAQLDHIDLINTKPK